MLRTGVDLLHLTRFAQVLARYERRFLHKVFTERECRECNGDVQALAGRFALKEATSKALGTGLWRARVFWRDIEIVRAPRSGAPVLFLAAGAADKARRQHLQDWSLSLSHDGEYVVAFVVAVAGRAPAPDGAQENPL